MTLLHQIDQDTPSSQNIRHHQQEQEHLYRQQQWRSELALLARLQEMVPIMPRERQLTKLEVINYVIDYIRQLKELVDY